MTKKKIKIISVDVEKPEEQTQESAPATKGGKQDWSFVTEKNKRRMSIPQMTVVGKDPEDWSNTPEDEVDDDWYLTPSDEDIEAFKEMFGIDVRELFPEDFEDNGEDEA